MALGDGNAQNQLPSRQIYLALGVIIAVAFLVRLGTALAFPNVHYPDETFQYIEQAHRLAFGYGVVPWEWRDGIRSWAVPRFLGGRLATEHSVLPLICGVTPSCPRWASRFRDPEKVSRRIQLQKE